MSDPRHLALVSLVGAGPGAPDLITVRGLHRLRAADVVLYDRLTSAQLLAEAPASAVRISVAKTPGGPAVPQAEINRLIVEHARAGRRVVRLKGGDPFLFGRGGEELLACAREGIPCEVVPGLTSAMAAPAAAGIPVTHRQLAATFTVVTGHRAPAASDAGEPDHEPGEVDWRVAASADTLVVLMGVGRIESICGALIEHGKAPSTPAATVERATMDGQRIVRGTLETLPDLVRAARVATPAATIVGDVVTLGEEASEVLDAADQMLRAEAAAWEPNTTLLHPSARLSHRFGAPTHFMFEDPLEDQDSTDDEGHDAERRVR